MTRATPRTFAALALAALLGVSSPAFAQDLFTNGPLSKAFEGDPPKQAPVPAPAGNLTPQKLQPFLKAAGFEPEDLGEFVFKIKVESGDWTFPVIVSLSPGKTKLWVNIGLVSVKDGHQVPVESLLELLSANEKFGPAFFSYLPKPRLLRFNRPYHNDGLKPESFKRDLDDLSKMLMETESHWNAALWGRPAAPRHVGAWLAIRGQVAFRLELNADGSFTLVNRGSAGETRNTGRYTLAGGGLSLVGTNGDRVEAAIAFNGDDTFTFTIKGTQNALRFTREPAAKIVKQP